ncbi:MAG: tetratricopeptide repeat protein, partial [Spirochaetales bacterium]|nr:tetratricopeptide repeat protein [Spirochaetales bacterium]
VIILTSCSNPGVYFSVWNGNNAFDRGDYQAANTKYLRALKNDVHTPFVNYNLANVYYALGEAEAAADEWQKSAITKNHELLFRTLYNRGVLEFERGQYQQAFHSFRKALEVQPDSLAAKINIEYSLRRMNASQNPAQKSAAGADVTDDDGLSDEVARVLEFVKQKDSGMWQASEEGSAQTDARDW